MVDISKVRAIDIHTHAEEPCGCHGDDGYGDRPVDMPRIVYWFQHVDKVPSPPPANTPELIQAAARRLAQDRERSPRR